MGNLKTDNTSYPTSIDTATSCADVTDKVVAAHQNGPNSAIIAIENELGVSPKGTAATVVGRLSVNMGLDGGIRQGSAPPGSPPNTPHLFYRTDQNLLYVYNISTANYDVVANATILASYVRLDIPNVITAQHTIAPTVPSTAPFVLGSNAYDQKVSRFNADEVDGFHASQSPVENQIPVTDSTGGLTLDAGAQPNGLTIKSTSASQGVNLVLEGNGNTTPKKFIRVIDGVLEVVNNAYSQALLSLTDAGVLSTPGGFNGNALTSSSCTGNSLTAISASSATDATNVTGTIGSHNITAIFEVDGITVKDATRLANSFLTPGTIYSTPSSIRNQTSASYTKMFEVAMPISGTVLTSFGLNTGVVGTAYGRVYVNGSAVGTERSTTSTGTVFYTENINVVKGDLLQLYCHADAIVHDMNGWYFKFAALIAPNFPFTPGYD